MTGWVVAILLALLLIAAMDEPAAAPAGAPPPTTLPLNPGGGHCGFGPNDDDVRAVIRAIPSTIPHC